ncbi:AAA family ATPase [Cupriavidus sp. CuC1]|uniref:AAA family ATPase n=1 Tax=Cupriavidus sp. CuC1 TaxID=3373131 RepID=UPI0037D62BD8
MSDIHRFCLIGPHGVGKSTIGRMLADRGFWHLSIGTLRRLARKGMLPSDIPIRLLVTLRDADPGRPLPDLVVAAVIELAKTRDRVVIDGLPSSPSHLALLDPSWRIISVTAPDELRLDRLKTRAGQSARAWVAARASARDLQLRSVIEAAGARIERFDNSAGLDVCRDRAWRLGANRRQ